MPKTTPSEDAITKMYVLDTSVLLSHPNAIHQFVEHEVVLPLAVIEELEAKRNHPVLGWPARDALREIAAIQAKDPEKGAIGRGIRINDRGGVFRIEMNHIDDSGLPPSIAAHNNDSRILAVAFNFHQEGRDVTVVSKDLPMRLKAEAIGLGGEEYRNEMVVVDKPYTGIEEIEVSKSVIDTLYKNRILDSLDRGLPDGVADLPVNTGVLLIGPGKASALAHVTADKTLALISGDRNVFGVTGRSAEQKVGLEHLMDPDIGIVSLGGPAGTGKTFLAIAAGLEQVMEQRKFKKVVVFRSLFAVGGQELGYLPGDQSEKMSPWGAAIFDALEAMTSKEVVDEIIERNMLEVLPLTHLRGRTLHDAYIVVDEAQNLEKPVLLTVLSRLAGTSKVVLSHDVAQRDNMRVGRHDGIHAVVERLKGHPLFAHTTFSKSERGPVAEMVTSLMDDMVA